ncbi:MAG TPA: carbohydrate ABC transporter permease [Oscillospiraceae bacterium]|nr:carbohydrate ABC transporter permease [Oscillospiraceae bacterium]
MSSRNPSIVTAKKDSSVKARMTAKKVLIYVVCIFLALLGIVPFYILIINSTRSQNQLMTGFSLLPSVSFKHNYDYLVETIKASTFISAFFNSFIIATATTVFSVYFSSLTAYALVVYNFRLKRAAFTFIMIVLMIPSQVSIVGFINFVMSLNMYDTFWPLILPSIAAPATVFFMRQFMLSGLPLEIVEAARIDGASEFGIFNRIALPILKPAIATQAIFAFTASWNNLFTPSMLLNSTENYTMPMIVQMLRVSDNLLTKGAAGSQYIGLLITIIPMLVVYLLLSKYIIRGVALGGVKE